MSENNFEEQSSNKLKDIESLNLEGLPLKISQSIEELGSGTSEKSQVDQINTFGTIMNLLNSVLGISILTIPNFMINTGIIGSIILLLIISFLSYYSTKIILTLQIETESDGFDSIALKLLGKKGSILLSFVMLLFLVIGLISFLIIGSDMIKSWLTLLGYQSSTFQSRTIIILIYSFLIPFLLTFPRSISFLSFFSTITVFCIFLYVFSIIIKSIGIIYKNGIHNSVVYFKFNFGIFQTLAIFGLSFCFPAIILPIIKSYDELLDQRKNVSKIAIFLCFLLIGTSGILGYLSFGNTSDPNILNSFSNNDYLIIIVRFSFFIVVSFAYPLVAQGVMCSWSSLFFNHNHASSLPTIKRLFIIFMTNIIPLLFAIFLSSVKTALAIGGALGSCLVNFTYPGLF